MQYLKVFIVLLFAGFFLLLLSINVHAQSGTGADYFTGKWSVLVKGTPNGDAKMFIVLDKKDSTLTGSVQDSSGGIVARATVKLTQNGTQVTRMTTANESGLFTFPSVVVDRPTLNPSRTLTDAPLTGEDDPV